MSRLILTPEQKIRQRYSWFEEAAALGNGMQGRAGSPSLHPLEGVLFNMLEELRLPLNLQVRLLLVAKAHGIGSVTLSEYRTALNS